MTSGDKIRFFFEEGVFDDEGNLKYDKQLSLNKIGHALHSLEPEFRKVTFGDKVKVGYQIPFMQNLSNSSSKQNLARELDFKDPVIAQSMYIFKVQVSFIIFSLLKKNFIFPV